jgi:hypothetical protein
VAARKKEGSFDENHAEKKSDGDAKKKLLERKKKAEEISRRSSEPDMHVNVALLCSQWLHHPIPLVFTPIFNTHDVIHTHTHIGTEFDCTQKGE